MASEQNFQCGRLETDDPALFEEVIRPWDLMIDVVGNANPYFEIDFLSMPGLTVYKDCYSGGIRLQGMPPPDTLVLSVPYCSTGNSRFWASSIDKPQLYAMHATPLDAYLTDQHRNLVIFVDLEQACHLEASHPSLSLAVEKLLDHSRHERIAQDAQAINRLSRTALHLLNRASSNHYDNLTDLRQEFEVSLAETVLQERMSSPQGRPDKKAAAVTAALDYLQMYDCENVSVSKLCQQTGVNERTLERGVRATFDCTVLSFLRRWRLHAARRRLVSTAPDEGSVTEIAYSLGFYDLGRFSTKYRREFGEYPSQALQRPERSTDLTLQTSVFNPS